MIKLYQFKTSPFSEKVRRALHYKQIDYEIVEVPRNQAEEFKSVSPSGKFPAMEHDGEAILDSTDIIRHLDARFPERPLIPSGARQAAQAHIIEDWADESLYFYEITMRLAWEHNNDKVIEEFLETMPGDLTVEQARPLFKQFTDPIVNAQGLGRKPRAMVVADCDRHFHSIDALLASSDWLVGDSLSIADLAVTAQLHALLYASEARASLERSVYIEGWMGRVDALAPPHRS